MSLRDALRTQAAICETLGSPFTARLLNLMAERLVPGTPLSDWLFGWPGDISGAGQSVPLRLAGTLHGLVLDGTAPDLAAHYPPNPASSDDAFWSAIDNALNVHSKRCNDWMNRPPQTNEVGRSAVLIAAGHWLAAEYRLPLILSELGASAGLNLMWDRYALQLPSRKLGPPDAALTLAPKWSGDEPPAADPQITERRGADLTPLDPQAPADRLRLSAYIWPDQTDRLARTRAALRAATATVDIGDAADWLETRLGIQAPNLLHLIYHTIAWQYFPPAVQARAQTLIEAAGTRATAQSPIAWLGMEADGTTPGAGLTLRLWPGNRRIALGRADFHGRWVDWRPVETRSSRTK